MQIEQANLLDCFGAAANENSKGIANYIRDDSKNAGVGTPSGESYRKHEAAEVQASGSVYMGNATYMRPGQDEDEKSVVDKIEQQKNQTAMERSNQAAVVANTTTPEDCARMQEDGFSLGDMDSQTILTVTDKIKAALAQAGVDIASFGGSLSREELEKLVGDQVLASRIAEQMESRDVPLTEENLQDIGVAVSMINDVHSLDDRAIAYLIQHRKLPTIQNIYQAEYSSFEPQKISDYGATIISDRDFEAMRGQVSQIIVNAGLPVNEEAFADSKWLIEQGIPLTSENLSYMEQLKELSARLADYTQLKGDMQPEVFSQENGLPIQEAGIMTDAILEGKRPWDGMLIEGYSWADQAQKAVQTIAEATDEDLAYLIEQGRELTVENLDIARKNRQEQNPDEAEGMVLSQKGLQLLTAQRQLEETRLAMTAQANYALLKKGISIYTEPLVSLVEKLKAQENQYYRDLLGQAGIETTEENVSTFSTTTEFLKDLKFSPAYVLNITETEDTLTSLHEKGQELKLRFAEANERYENLMTAPRADMGDSIQKAFQNVDDILKDIGLQESEANRRAVRILAYNKVPLTVENIVQIKAKDEQVQQTFANLTPNVTMELIRRNKNPLDMEITELNQLAESIREELGDSGSQRFSEYLWKLDQKNGITEEERASYIGIYRLMAQVEKADGAAIGALAAQGAQLTMRNMLSAVRTANKGNMDYSVSDEFEGVSSFSKGPRIDSQIEAAYQRDCAKDIAREITPDMAEKIQQVDWEDMTPEQLKEFMGQSTEASSGQEEAYSQTYQEEQLKEYQMTMSTSKEMYAYLERHDIPDTMNHVQAVTQMLSNPSGMFRTLWNTKDVPFDRKQAMDQMKQMVLERFGEAIKTPQELADAQETLAEVAEHAMEGMIYDNDTVSYLDVRMLRLMNQQFSICARQAKEENYVIPVETSDGITGVSLKIVRGKEQKGLVDILFRGDSMGKVAASFEAKENGISGMIATDDEETGRMISEHLKELTDVFQEADDALVDLRVAVVPDLSLEQYALRADSRHSQYTGEYEPMQTSRLYHIAESFIKSVQKFL